MRATVIHCSRDCSDRMRYNLYTAEVGAFGCIVSVGKTETHCRSVIIAWFLNLITIGTRPGMYEHVAIKSEEEQTEITKIICNLFDVTNINVIDYKTHWRLLEDIVFFCEYDKSLI